MYHVVGASSDALIAWVWVREQDRYNTTLFV
jgi:hypothetical protein